MTPKVKAAFLKLLVGNLNILAESTDNEDEATYMSALADEIADGAIGEERMLEAIEIISL